MFLFCLVTLVNHTKTYTNFTQTFTWHDIAIYCHKLNFYLKTFSIWFSTAILSEPANQILFGTRRITSNLWQISHIILMFHFMNSYSTSSSCPVISANTKSQHYRLYSNICRPCCSMLIVEFEEICYEMTRTICDMKIACWKSVKEL